MYRVLIVEDDPGIASAIADQTKLWGLDTRCVVNFRNVMADFADFAPHLVLLDIALPFFNGYHWCSEIRKVSKVPVIFISSASDNMNIVMAMNMGADDFTCGIRNFSGKHYQHTYRNRNKNFSDGFLFINSVYWFSTRIYLRQFQHSMFVYLSH